MKRFDHALWLLLLLFSPPATSESETYQQTARYLGIQGIIGDIHRQVEKSQKSPHLVIWMIDHHRLLAEHKVLETFQSQIVQHFAGKASSFPGIQMAVLPATLPKNLPRPSSKVRDFRSSWKQFEKPPTHSYVNLMASVRKVSTSYAGFPGSRHLVVLSLDNGDGEDHLESTAKLVRRTRFQLLIISREAILSDPHWARQPPNPGKVPFALEGPECAHREIPWGWALQNSDSHEGVASGYGIYGLQRLVAQTRGRYYLYYPPTQEGSGHCARYRCRLCNGQHSSCSQTYRSERLQFFAPLAESRSQYQARQRRSKAHALLLSTWKTAHKKGWLRSAPPYQPGKTVVPGARRQSGPTYGTSHLDPARVSSLAKRAIKDRKQILALIQKIEKAVGVQKIDRKSPREIAACDVLLAQLHCLRFNLLQLIHFSHQLDSWRKAKGKPLDPWTANPIQGKPGTRLWIYVQNLTFCHGTERLHEIRWLGGPEADQELKLLSSRISRLLEKYDGTPYEMAVRWIGLSIFEPYEYTPQTATAQAKRRRAQSSEDENATTDDPPPGRRTTPPPTRSRSGRSGVTSGE